MKTAVIALAAVLAFSGAAFAKDNAQQGTANAPEVSTVVSKRFIDPQTTGSIAISVQTETVPADQRLGGGVDPSVLPNF